MIFLGFSYVELKEAAKDGLFVVLGVLDGVFEDQDWWYLILHVNGCRIMLFDNDMNYYFYFLV
jgi:hypothetical protein